MDINMIEWQPIRLDSIFQEFVRGKVSSVIDETKDPNGIPYVGATTRNNGVLDFLVSDTEKKQRGNCIVFIRDGQGSVGLSVYRSTPFIATVNTSSGYSNWLNKYNGIFVSVSSNQVRVKYSFGYKRKEERLLSEKIMLPVNKNDKPDYSFMTKFIKEKQDELLLRYSDFCGKQISKVKYKVIPLLEEKEWKDYSITSLFNTLIAGKGKGLNHLHKTKESGISYIGATNRNNGVLCFVSEDDSSLKMLLPGNCIGFIKNGDGSAGFAIYKAESFISTSDVIYGYSNWLNKYTGLFFVAAQDMIEHKYSHGYKRNRQHLKGDRVMLPADSDGNPDFKYMEQYAKNMMLKKYKQYLSFLERKEQKQ